MTTISAKFTQKEIEYLTRLAQDNHLYRGNSKEPSIGKAMKELVKWCCMSDIHIGATTDYQPSGSNKMLEQIHAIMPNLMYLLRMQLLFTGETLSDEKVALCRRQAIDFINANCGAFQEIQYNQISPTDDDQGLPKLPIDQRISKWKSKKI